MSSAAAITQITLAEAKLVWRDPAGVFLPLGLPLLVIVMNGLSSDPSSVDGSGISAASALGVPAGFATIMAILTLVNLPSFIAAYRSDGVLRRLAVTPARPTWVLLGQVLVNFALALVGTAIALAAVAIGFELVAPRLLAWTLIAALLMTAAMYGLGLIISSLAPSSSSATAIGLVVFLGMLTIGGGTVPVEVLPGFLAEIGSWLPFGAGTDAMQSAWIGRQPAWADLAVLTGTAVVSTLVASRSFRWQ